MPSKETLIKDLNDICAATDASWLCALDIYTLNINADEQKFLEVLRKAGLSKKDALFRGMAELEYGGGLRLNYKDVLGGGYTFHASIKNKPFMVFGGFETDYEQVTIYHECAHLYQHKLNLFSKQEVKGDSSYQKYLHEVHANTFASMLMLLRAEDVLSFKKQQNYCLAADINEFNRNSQKSKFYYSLPIVLQLIKDVRHQGRDNALQKFSKNGYLDFEKIALYTADFVKKYAYTPIEFYQITHNIPFSSYNMLKQKAKSWHHLGKRYISLQTEKLQQQKENYRLIEEKRRIETAHKTTPLPEVDDKAKIINAACKIDVLNTRLSQDFGIYQSINNLIEQKFFYMHDISDENKRQQVSQICDNMAEIYQTWRKDLFFKKLLSKIDHPDTRDSVWTLKFKKEQEIFSTLQQTSVYQK